MTNLIGPWDQTLGSTERPNTDRRSSDAPGRVNTSHKHGVSVEAANRLLASVADLEVEIHYDCGACEPAPRSVKWADLEDTDGEDEKSPEAAVGSKGVSEHAPESSGPRARMGIAAGGKGVSWHAPEPGDFRAPLDPVRCPHGKPRVEGAALRAAAEGSPWGMPTGSPAERTKTQCTRVWGDERVCICVIIGTAAIGIPICSREEV